MPPTYVADVADLDANGRKVLRVGAVDIALLRFGDDVLAFENVCAHMGGPVGEGMIANKVTAVIGEDGRYLGEDFVPDELHLVCPWHGWEYRLPGGECAVAPERRLRRFPVTVDDGRILVTLEARDLTVSPG